VAIANRSFDLGIYEDVGRGTLGRGFAMKKISVSLTLAFVGCAMVGGGRVCGAQTPVPVVVELFTSEGCSSCPPADAFLERLRALQPFPGARLIVLSEHVTYWNHDGWKDPYSSDQLTERQDSYVQRLGLPSAYTPQFMVDGASELKASDPEQVRGVFEKVIADQKIPVTISSVHIDSAGSQILRGHIDIDGTTNKHDAEVFLAVTLNEVNSDVSAGENKGRKLTEVAVVVELEKLAKIAHGGSLSRDFEVKLKPNVNPANVGLVAFAQANGSGKIVGAAALDKIN
jgi:hypothetical protein